MMPIDFSSTHIGNIERAQHEIRVGDLVVRTSDFPAEPGDRIAIYRRDGSFSHDVVVVSGPTIGRKYQTCSNERNTMELFCQRCCKIFIWKSPVRFHKFWDWFAPAFCEDCRSLTKGIRL
jgi:hypothetical protein